MLVKIPRSVAKAGDITGGLPRVTELFEARNPSNPAIVAEIDGEVTMGKVKRGNREIILTSKVGDVRKYLVPLSKQILVQENDYVRAGTPLSDGLALFGFVNQDKIAREEYGENEVGRDCLCMYNQNTGTGIAIGSLGITMHYYVRDPDTGDLVRTSTRWGV